MKCIVPERRKFIYLPALNTAIVQYKRRFVGSDGQEYVSNWWDKDSPFYYDCGLISAYYGMDVGVDFREKFGLNKEFQLYADSGGYQVVTQKANISSLDVLQWQEKTSQYGLILDHPPYEEVGAYQFGGNIYNVFDKSLQRTRENAELMLKNKDKDFKLYGVIQGESPAQMKEWHKSISSLEDQYEKFHAWALSPKPSYDVMKIGLFGVMALENLNTPLHILQVSGHDSTLISAYIASLYKRKVTLDSSSYMIGVRYGQAKDDWDLRKSWNFGTEETKQPVHFSRMPSCDIIGRILSEVPIKDYDSTHYNFLNLHNLLKFIQFFNYLEVLSEKREEFVKYVKDNCNEGSKVMMAIEMVDYGYENGLDRAFEKYKDRISMTEKPVKQDSIFGEWK